MTPKQSGWDRFNETLVLNDVYVEDDEVHDAFILAEMAHAGQTRREWDESNLPVPYFEHPKRAARILIEELGVTWNNSLISAILLHDTLEDTTLTKNMIRNCCGVYTELLVQGLTAGPDKDLYINSFQTTPLWELPLLKACDRLDNLRSLPKARSEKFTRKKVEETGRYLPAFARLVEIVPEDVRRAAAKVNRLIQEQLAVLTPL